MSSPSCVMGAKGTSIQILRHYLPAMSMFLRSVSYPMKLALSIMFGGRCEVCGEITALEFVCSSCLLRLPYVDERMRPWNRILQRFEGAIPICRAYSLCYYIKGQGSQRIVTSIKYRHAQALGEWAGTFIADDALSSGIFDGVDLLQPIPIHLLRLLKRSYNQSELIVRGIRKRTGIPIASLVRRRKYNVSQTKFHAMERRENVVGAFEGRRKAILKALDEKDRKGKEQLHIAIVDDVITTGSTIINCARAIMQAVPERADEICFTVISLAISGRSPIGAVTSEKLNLPDATISNEEFLALQHHPLS